MSCSYAKGWGVRWRAGSGRKRSERFHDEEAAREFDASIHDVGGQERGRHAHPFGDPN